MWFWTQSPAFPDCVASFICLAPPAFSGSRKCPVSSTFLRLAHLYICVLAFLLMQVLRPGVFSPPSHKTVPQWGSLRTSSDNNLSLNPFLIPSCYLFLRAEANMPYSGVPQNFECISSMSLPRNFYIHTISCIHGFSCFLDLRHVFFSRFVFPEHSLAVSWDSINNKGPKNKEYILKWGIIVYRKKKRQVISD